MPEGKLVFLERANINDREFAEKAVAMMLALIEQAK